VWEKNESQSTQFPKLPVYTSNFPLNAPFWGGKVHVCVFIDFFSRIVISVNGVPIVLKQVSVRHKKMWRNRGKSKENQRQNRVWRCWISLVLFTPSLPAMNSSPSTYGSQLNFKPAPPFCVTPQTDSSKSMRIADWKLSTRKVRDGRKKAKICPNP
jgi:hypothetical protein